MEKAFKFVIPGKAQPKQRARTCRNKHTGRSISFTPAETVNYENLVKFSFINAGGEIIPEGAISLTIVCNMEIPASASKKKQALMASNEIMPTKKPDLDNIIKSIKDGLNKVAWKDDSQVVCISAIKRYNTGAPFTGVIVSQVEALHEWESKEVFDYVRLFCSAKKETK